MGYEVRDQSSSLAKELAVVQTQLKDFSGHAWKHHMLSLHASFMPFVDYFEGFLTDFDKILKDEFTKKGLESPTELRGLMARLRT